MGRYRPSAASTKVAHDKSHRRRSRRRGEAMRNSVSLRRPRGAVPAVVVAALAVAVIEAPSATAAPPTPPPTPSFLTSTHSDVASADDTPSSSPDTPGVDQVP